MVVVFHQTAGVAKEHFHSWTSCTWTLFMIFGSYSKGYDIVLIWPWILSASLLLRFRRGILELHPGNQYFGADIQENQTLCQAHEQHLYQ
jgi:hypothetical protein